jgi:hypothetical protein
MKLRTIVAGVLLMGICQTGIVKAQTISKDELIFLTSEWKGERFNDGRPKISDDLIQRAKNIGIEEAWTVLKNEGYNNQFEGNWKLVHDDRPVVGRAVTAMFMPSRPDIEKTLKTVAVNKAAKGIQMPGLLMYLPKAMYMWPMALVKLRAAH